VKKAIDELGNYARNPKLDESGVTLKILVILVMRMKSSNIRGQDKSKNNAGNPRATRITESKEIGT
jgi:hypothetical protein